MNPHLAELHPYPFEKLAKLKSGINPPDNLPHIALSIGEPQHAAPEFVKRELANNLDGLSKYPMTVGMQELRQSITDWLTKRFRLYAGLIDAEKNVLPVNGTREALFAVAHCFVNPKPDALVLMPNPFYQIYEGAALLAGAKPYFINTTAETGFIPDYDSVPEDVWKRCQLLYLCSPGNPTGAVLPPETTWKLIERATKYGFIIAADECYSEIYFDELHPPAGLLEVEAEAGNGKFENCLVFHSLSKRSNLPGMRSGFVAGDAALIEQFRQYRTYHGNAMSPPYQAASVAAWRDEQHVIENRKLYKQKFDEVLKILQPVMDVQRPDAGFYLWPKTPMPDQEFARELFRRYNLTVLPGSYLSREAHGINPGENRVRMALVASLEECVEAARRIRTFIESM
jgi:N-succinyldiaminopimelate aminotransferase